VVEGLVNQAKVTLPNGRPPESVAVRSTDPERLRARVQELEDLCAEVYWTAVEMGLPQPLLNRLWTVAAKGSAPHTWSVDIAAPSDAATPPDVVSTLLTDPGRASDSVSRLDPPDLKPIAERRRVMVVDDDPMMMDVLVRILERENFDLVTAASGREALSKLDGESTTIDLLITDYAMPGMKGRELAEQVRQRHPELRVLYQTGFSDLLFENRAELEDDSAFLEKPFTARGLREAARLALFGVINPS
jgi:CheY-like chemotaxis protein